MVEGMPDSDSVRDRHSMHHLVPASHSVSLESAYFE